jgi:hypothetical protein
VFEVIWLCNIQIQRGEWPLLRSLRRLLSFCFGSEVSSLGRYTLYLSAQVHLHSVEGDISLAIHLIGALITCSRGCVGSRLSWTWTWLLRFFFAGSDKGCFGTFALKPFCREVQFQATVIPRGVYS